MTEHKLDNARETRLDNARETRLDITRETCPMTFVRTRLALDRMASGDILQVRLLGEEPRRNVVLNAEALGHTVLSDQPAADGLGHDGVRLVAIRRR